MKILCNRDKKFFNPDSKDSSIQRRKLLHFREKRFFISEMKSSSFQKKKN
jgi:hypothetical protein